MGFVPVVAPVLAVTGVEPALRLPEHIAATVVTSRNALRKVR